MLCLSVPSVHYLVPSLYLYCICIFTVYPHNWFSIFVSPAVETLQSQLATSDLIELVYLEGQRSFENINKGNVVNPWHVKAQIRSICIVAALWSWHSPKAMSPNIRWSQDSNFISILVSPSIMSSGYMGQDVLFVYGFLIGLQSPILSVILLPFISQTNPTMHAHHRPDSDVMGICCSVPVQTTLHFLFKRRAINQPTPHLRPSPRSPQCYNLHHNSHTAF